MYYRQTREERAAELNQLRDDVLAQLRTAKVPLTTTQLRQRAPRGLYGRPVAEEVYSILVSLERHGLVKREAKVDRKRAWSAAPCPADDEIASLQAAFDAPTYPGD